MRILVLALVAAAVAAAGCVTPPSTDPAPAAGADAEAEPMTLAPAMLEWQGHVLHSAVDGPSHFRPTEDVLWPVQQEGFLLHVEEVPLAMEVALEWEGEGQFMIMLHSHKAEGTNEYVEHVSEMSADQPKCIRVPAEDLTTGHWQVMIHNRGAMNVDFTLRVLTLGGLASIVDDDRHGHWPQDGMFTVEDHEVLPCEMYAPAVADA